MRPCVYVLPLVAILLFSDSGFAARKDAGLVRRYRFEGGAFDGRIARTQSGNTIPFNSPNGTFLSGEIQFGETYRLLAGASYYNYIGLTATATSVNKRTFNYGDVKAGVSLALPWTEWRLIYVNHNTPYTELPEVNTLVPHTATIHYLRLENILYARASNFTLAFAYFLNQALNEPAVTGGNFKNSLFIGGCVRVFFGQQFRVGPEICIDLQEAKLPLGTVMNRQEVHARLTFEF